MRPGDGRRRSTVSEPALESVLETVLYYTEDERTAEFYGSVLGMRVLERDPGRHQFYRAGSSVFLLFRAEETLRSESLPPHGAHGPGHVCFRVSPGDYEVWKVRLAESGVPMLQETVWSRGLSFYFHDPDGNVLWFGTATRKDLPLQD